MSDPQNSVGCVQLFIQCAEFAQIEYCERIRSEGMTPQILQVKCDARRILSNDAEICLSNSQHPWAEWLRVFLPLSGWNKRSPVNPSFSRARMMSRAFIWRSENEFIQRNDSFFPPVFPFIRGERKQSWILMAVFILRDGGNLISSILRRKSQSEHKG